ncbi:MAG: DUF459 domain-containing protein [Hyphomicrobiaceae bacterium]|nr:DUF459 domain-containing protein [Hyphomicrobiaceae bacterium]
MTTENSRLRGGLCAALALLALVTVAASPAAAQDDGAGSYITPFPQGDVYRLVVLGDDLADGLLGGVVDALSTDSRLQIDKKVVALNGLNRAEFPEKLQAIEEQLGQSQPHIAVVMMGAWDRVSMKGTGKRTTFGTPEWKAEYAARADRVMKALKRKNIAVYWVGLPNVRRADMAEDVQMMNQILRDRIYLNGMKYIDAYAGFADEAGEYSSYGPDVTGKMRLLRDGDGVYFTVAGYRKLAHFVERDLKRDLTQAKGERAIPLAGAEDEQAKINPERAAQKKAEEDAAAAKKTAAAAGGDGTPADATAATPAVPAGSPGGEQKGDNGRIVLKSIGAGGREESITVDIVRPPIPASVVALVTRKESSERLSQMGEQVLDQLPGGLSVMNSITPAAGSSGGAQRRLSTVQTPYYRVFIKGERLPPRRGRADDFTWPRPEPPLPPAALLAPPADATGLETGSAAPGSSRRDSRPSR